MALLCARGVTTVSSCFDTPASLIDDADRKTHENDHEIKPIATSKITSRSTLSSMQSVSHTCYLIHLPWNRVNMKIIGCRDTNIQLYIYAKRRAEGLEVVSIIMHACP